MTTEAATGIEHAGVVADAVLRAHSSPFFGKWATETPEGQEYGKKIDRIAHAILAKAAPHPDAEVVARTWLAMYSATSTPRFNPFSLSESWIKIAVRARAASLIPGIEAEIQVANVIDWIDRERP